MRVALVTEKKNENRLTSMISLISVKGSMAVNQGKDDHLINTVDWMTTWKYRDLVPLSPLIEWRHRLNNKTCRTKCRSIFDSNWNY